MADKDILQRVIEVFATMTETADEITADSQLIEDLEISSMDVLYLISSVEEEFKIKVSEKAIRRMATIGDVAEIITELTGK